MTATAAAAMTGTPRGATGTSRTATAAPQIATQAAPRLRNRGHNSARKTAGAAASRPNAAGSIALPSTAPARLPSCQRANRTSPVAQNAYLFARTVVCPVAIAVVSSTTSCAANSRSHPPGCRISDTGTPYRALRTPSSSAGPTAANGDPADAAMPTKANCEAPENITRLSTMVCAIDRPDATETAPNAAPRQRHRCRCRSPRAESHHAAAAAPTSSARGYPDVLADQGDKLYQERRHDERRQQITDRDHLQLQQP